MTEPQAELLTKLKLVDELFRQGLLLQQAAVQIQVFIVMQSMQHENTTTEIDEEEPGKPLRWSVATGQHLNATTAHGIGYVGGNVSYHYGSSPEKPPNAESR